MDMQVVISVLIVIVVAVDIITTRRWTKQAAENIATIRATAMVRLTERTTGQNKLAIQVTLSSNIGLAEASQVLRNIAASVPDSNSYTPYPVRDADGNIIGSWIRSYT